MVRGRAVAVVALVLLAGCQGFDGGGDKTVTPAPVPTASGEGVGDADAIAERHRAALSNRSYTATAVWRVTYPNGSTGRLTDTFVVSDGPTYSYERRQRGSYPGDRDDISIYQTDDTEFVRLRAENGTTDVRTRPTTGFDDTSLSDFVRGLLDRFDLAVEQTTDRAVLTGSQHEFRTIPLPGDLRNGRNATVEATIRDGVVRQMTVSGRADHPDSGQSVGVSISLTVERVGRSEPERPAWANESAAGG
ncbi:hypothetical protein [Haloarcula salinisoli]|uniref:Uncharacterized protein n=1 Tax=Haloarcula salinisoli TaxID=2487746 RepID=A0A8J7YFB5_9EURY|nr:hypothetical protein [Halomicroarcula salinisoli]MBX0304850.1 hypothetical protein [Halomicroarcula salinisoli]